MNAKQENQGIVTDPPKMSVIRLSPGKLRRPEGTCSKQRGKMFTATNV